MSDFVAGRPSLFDAGFSWPIATLSASAIDNNVGVLADWCEANGVLLAPHGKTTMAPALFSRQLAAGAWAMTAATPWQVRVYRAHGVSRVLLANELVDVEFIRWLAAERADDPGFEFICYVDSAAGVDLLGHALAASDPLMRSHSASWSRLVLSVDARAAEHATRFARSHRQCNATHRWR